MSNQSTPLFFVDEVTNKARYTQIPLPSNYTSAQVFGNVLGVGVMERYLYIVGQLSQVLFFFQLILT